MESYKKLSDVEGRSVKEMDNCKKLTGNDCCTEIVMEHYKFVTELNAVLE